MTYVDSTVLSIAHCHTETRIKNVSKNSALKKKALQLV